MACQTGIIGIQGTVGSLVFSKNGNISQKPQSNKAAFASAPSRARTRENAAEFGLSASYSKVLRDSLRVAIASASDSRVASRLTKAMREVIGLDDTNDRGQRVFDSTNSAPLLGFNFNAGAGIGQTMYFPYEVTGAGTDVTIPALNPASDIAAPQGTTHFEVVFAASSLDMETLTYTNAVVAAPLGILAVNSPEPAHGPDGRLPAGRHSGGAESGGGGQPGRGTGGGVRQPGGKCGRGDAAARCRPGLSLSFHFLIFSIMALTAYQQQFKRRMKRAISLRAKADQKAPRYTKLLSDAIGAAEDAAMQMNALNQLYNVDVSTYTLLTQALHANSGQEVLKDHLAQSTPGEEAVLFNQVPDGHGGQSLPNNPLFGELVAGMPVIPPAQTAKALAQQVDPASAMPATKVDNQAREALM